jgi:hypothetical protein
VGSVAGEGSDAKRLLALLPRQNPRHLLQAAAAEIGRMNGVTTFVHQKSRERDGVSRFRHGCPRGMSAEPAPAASGRLLRMIGCGRRKRGQARYTVYCGAGWARGGSGSCGLTVSRTFATYKAAISRE